MLYLKKLMKKLTKMNCEIKEILAGNSVWLNGG